MINQSKRWVKLLKKRCLLPVHGTCGEIVGSVGVVVGPAVVVEAVVVLVVEVAVEVDVDANVEDVVVGKVVLVVVAEVVVRGAVVVLRVVVPPSGPQMQKQSRMPISGSSRLFGACKPG